jgi:hypothetical protein
MTVPPSVYHMTRTQDDDFVQTTLDSFPEHTITDDESPKENEHNRNPIPKRFEECDFL